MIKAFVFDVDGVLIKPLCFASVLDDEYGLTSAITDRFFTGPFAQCLVGQADLREVLSPFLEEWGWPHSLQEFVDRWFVEDAVLNAELISFAASMRYSGVPCYVASTQESYRAAHLERSLQFDQLFDGCFFSCRLGCCKPDRRFFDLVIAQIGVEPVEVLFLDDKHENVTAARLAGWNAGLYTWGMNPFDEGERKPGRNQNRAG